MRYIHHRRNTTAELAQTLPQYGVEIDVRSQGDTLILQHDPFVQGESFHAWLKGFQHQTLILNVKEEGLEDRLRSMMEQHGIEDYFLLDQSFPFLVKYAEALQGRSAVRFSEYESIETALCLEGRVKWVWVDCFTRFPLNVTDYQRLKQAGFKLCMVSPELHHIDRKEEIQLFAKKLNDGGMHMDAICTKVPFLWEECFS